MRGKHLAATDAGELCYAACFRSVTFDFVPRLIFDLRTPPAFSYSTLSRPYSDATPFNMRSERSASSLSLCSRATNAASAFERGASRGDFCFVGRQREAFPKFQSGIDRTERGGAGVGLVGGAGASF